MVPVGDGPLPSPNEGPEKARNCDFELAQKWSEPHSERGGPHCPMKYTHHILGKTCSTPHPRNARHHPIALETQAQRYYQFQSYHIISWSLKFKPKHLNNSTLENKGPRLFLHITSKWTTLQVNSPELNHVLLFYRPSSMRSWNMKRICSKWEWKGRNKKWHE